jgi:hypothetical protein
MARTNKIDNSLLKRLRLKEQNEKRKLEAKVQRERYLIVCEGAKTEPNYFKSIETSLQKGVVYLNILGIGANTTSVVLHAINESKKYFGTPEEFDNVWVVFDKDDFSDKKFNDAIFLALKNDIKCACSNEAFELWYILHFQYLNTALKREQYFEILSQNLGMKYEKNMPDIFEILTTKGNEKKAIKWAETLDAEADDSNPAKKRPHTKVYKLVKELNRFKE